MYIGCIIFFEKVLLAILTVMSVIPVMAELGVMDELALLAILAEPILEDRGRIMYPFILLGLFCFEF